MWEIALLRPVSFATPPAVMLTLCVRVPQRCCSSCILKPSQLCVCLQAADINALFGFRLECLERLGDAQGIKAWNRLNQLFNWLPLAALIENKVLCMHGGAPCLLPLACPALLAGKPATGARVAAGMDCEGGVLVLVRKRQQIFDKQRRECRP